MASPKFTSPEEFREVMDHVFSMLDDDPEAGPALREADCPQRFEFPDVDLVVHVRAAGEGEEGNILWTWDDDVEWEPRVKTTMSSETTNKYFQGKENIPVALARRRIKAGGDIKAGLALVPLIKPVQPRYIAYLEAEHPHLLV